jgi:inorganic pyrophosphatase
VEIVVETQKWGFKKIEKTKEGYKLAFLSPIPAPFNYGYIPKTQGDDGMTLDAIVLGGRVPMGAKLDVGIIGRVRFIDDGKTDDKFIATPRREA